MGLDELGADPYQRGAINCARKSVALAVLSILGAAGAFIQGGDNAVALASGAGAVAVFALIVTRWQLSKESLSCTDMC